MVASPALGHGAAAVARRGACRRSVCARAQTYGEVIDAFVAYNGRSSRGFGYVTFKKDEPAGEAVRKMNEPGFKHGWLGAVMSEDDKARQTRVEMAKERPKPRPEPRLHGDRREGAR